VSLKGRIQILERETPTGQDQSVEAAELDIPSICRRIWMREFLGEAELVGADIPAEFFEPLIGDSAQKKDQDDRAFVNWADQQRAPGLGAYRLATYQSRAREHLHWALAAEEILLNTPEEFADQIRRDFQANLRYSPLPELTTFDSPLTRRVREMARLATLSDNDPNRYRGPLALPEAVCRVILASPFAPFPQIVDVGGGTGGLMTAICTHSAPVWPRRARFGLPARVSASGCCVRPHWCSQANLN
jgi:hypothetical protein